MSAGARIPLDQALQVLDALVRRWELDLSTCRAVGSVRRKRAEVGDLELIAPVPAAGGPDTLHDRILATIETDGLFGSKPDSIGKAERGLKPGFLACSLLIRPWPGVELPVQVYRYTPENLGWMLIERTGPREFGMWFLGKWKAQHRIPTGDHGQPASINNHLVDARRQVIPVRTEEEAFDRAALGFVEPSVRDEFIEKRFKAGARQ